MSFTAERIEQEPIILIRMIAPLHPVDDLAELYRQTDALAAEIPGKIYRLMDWTQAQLTFDLIQELLDIQRRSAASTAPKSPRVKNHYIVADEMGHLLIESLRQNQYGGLDVTIFSSEDEALQQIRQAIGNEQ